MKNLLFVLLLIAANTAYSQVQKIEKVIDSCVKDNFNGCVLLAKNGKTELLTYKGLSNRHYSIPFSDKSRFHIFSPYKNIYGSSHYAAVRKGER
jgi:hypothetical protein